MIPRQRIWVDRDVQGVLIGRVILYWGIGLAYLGLGSVFSQYYQNPQWTWQEHASTLFAQVWPWIPSLVLFMPLVVFDVVRMSNLFVGPVHRLRKHLVELKNDPQCEPLTFRPDDYWQNLLKPMNDLQVEILHLRAELDRPADEPAASQSSESSEEENASSKAVSAAPQSTSSPAEEGSAESPAAEASAESPVEEAGAESPAEETSAERVEA